MLCTRKILIMSRTKRNLPPGNWTDDFKEKLKRGLVELEKRDHTNMLGDIIWGRFRKRRAKKLRNRKFRRISTSDIQNNLKEN